MAELTREDFSAALAEIYTSLLDYAAKQLPDPSLTQDAVHDAIVYAYQNWNSDRCDLPAIQGWILNILQNRIRFLTRQYFQESKEIIHLHELPLCPWISSEDQLVQKERLQKLNAAFKAMDHRYARVCVSPLLSKYALSRNRLRHGCQSQHNSHLAYEGEGISSSLAEENRVRSPPSIYFSPYLC